MCAIKKPAILTLVYLFIFGSAANAAIKVVEPRELNDKSGFSGNISASMDISRGNSDSTETDLSGALYYDSNKTMSTVLVSHTFGSASGQSYANNLFAHLRSVYPLENTTYLSKEYMIQYNRDTFRNLQEREFAGGGVRYRFAGKNDNRLYAGIGLLGVREKENGLKSETFAAFNTYINNVINWADGKKLVSELSFQPHVGNPSDFRALGSISLDLPIVSQISLSCSVSVQVDSKPPKDIKQADTSTHFELKYSF